MTISSTTNRVDYTGNGAVSAYSYTFRIFSKTDLLVTVRNTSDVETTLVVDTDYTVDGIGDAAGGEITLVDASQAWLDGDGDLLTGYILTIRRVRPLKQETDIRNQGDFFPETHEDAFDHFVMISQQQQDELDRSVKLPETVASAGFSTELPTDIEDGANKVLIVNSDGDGLDLGPTSDEISNAQTYANNASTSATQAATSATNAATSATNASTSATNAASSATAAQAAVDAVAWSDVVFITDSDSPYSVTSSHRGKMIAVDASSGAVTLTLPEISGLDLGNPYVVAIKKTDSSGNNVTINRGGTDTIDGGTSKVLAAENSGAVFIPDTDPAPDEWTTAGFGASGGNMTIDRFDGNDSDVNFTLSVEPGTENNTWVFVDGVYQQKDTYSVSGTTLTFSSAPPTGTDNIEVAIGTTLSIGTPSDNTVSTAKIVNEAVILAKLANLATMKLIGRTTAGTGVPEAITLIDDDTMATAAATNVATAESVKAYADSLGLKVKVLLVQRDLSAAAGDVATTGVGFTPKALICFGAVGSASKFSVGFSDGTTNRMVYTLDGSVSTITSGSALVSIDTAGNVFQSAVVSSFDADGFTLTWSKTGSPTGTANLAFLAIG